MTIEEVPQGDPVNHPSHYTQGRYEVIDVIEDNLTFEGVEGYLVGNILKYLMRYRHKKRRRGPEEGSLVPRPTHQGIGDTK